jgi:oxygen-independent coproporphyrinogen-3 oxidase
VRAGARRDEMERYVAALLRELEWVPPGTELSHLFVGGGTPTALPAELLSRVLGAIFERMPSAGARAHTVEASPESIGEAHVRVLLDRGVRRVSMGIESMNEAVLSAVRRRHSAQQARDACKLLVASGLELNIDLIYGLPGQTEDSFRRDLDAAVEAGVDSVCLYALRLNSQTPVADQLGVGERFDLARLMRWRAFVTRSAAELGLRQTHPFTFKRTDGCAPAGRGSRKSMPGDLLGLGMGARSQLGRTMYRNNERAGVYVDRVERGESPVETLFDLDGDDLKTQYIAGTLTDGRPLERRHYEQTFGATIEDDFGERLERLARGGLLSDSDGRLTLTEMGTLVYDRVLLCFYPERAVRWLRENMATLYRGAMPETGASDSQA